MPTTNMRALSRRSNQKPRAGRFLTGLLAVLGVLAASADVRAQEAAKSSNSKKVLTVDETVQRAVERKAFVRRQQAEIDRQKAAKKDATRLPNPAFLYDREQWWQEGETFAQDWFLLSQTFELPGTRPARREALEAEVQASRLQRDRERRSVRNRARTAFYRLLAARRHLHRARVWVQRLQDVREVVKKRVSQGKRSGADLQRLTVDYETARADLAGMEAEYTHQKTRLLERLGVRRDPSSWELKGSLQGAKVELDREQALARLERRADFRAMEARVRAAEAQAREAKRSWLSELEVHGGYIRITEPGLTAHGFAAGLGIPLPIFDRNRAGVSQANAQKRKVESEMQLRQRRSSGEVRGLLEAAKRHRKAAERFRERGVKAARAQATSARASYDAGESSLLDLVEAQRVLYEAEQKLIDLRWSATQAELQLAGAIGPADQRSGAE